MTINAYVFALIAYLSGAIPWSVWLSRYVTNQDPRSVGDGNPGAANTFEVAGQKLGVTVLILDFLKAALPVGIAKWGFEFSDGHMLMIAIAPSIGHSFSIFLGFRGGRGLASLFGVWTGLTLYELPMVMGTTAVLGNLTTIHDDFKTLVLPVVALIYMLVVNKPDWMIGVILCQIAIISSKIGYFYATRD